MYEVRRSSVPRDAPVMRMFLPAREKRLVDRDRSMRGEGLDWNERLGVLINTSEWPVRARKKRKK